MSDIISKIISGAITGILLMCMLEVSGYQIERKPSPLPKGQTVTTIWMNDNIRPQLEAEKRQQANNNKLYYFSSLQPVLYHVGDRTIELGIRSDGVCVWRPAP